MSILSDELSVDPLALGYSGMSDAEVVTSLNTEDRSKNKTIMTATEVLNAIDISEWNALDADAQQRIWDVLHIGAINPFGVEATIFIAVFGSGSDTITALQASRIYNISRASELGIGFVKVGQVQESR